MARNIVETGSVLSSPSKAAIQFSTKENDSMGTTNAPSKVIRECDLILNGDLQQTPEQFQRWVVVQIKKLAVQSASRKMEHQRLQNKVRTVDAFAKGGLE